MKFITPCFIRTKDAGKRKELIAWLENIGYDCSTVRTDEVHYGKTEPVFIVVNGGHCRIQHNRPMLIEEYDCGTDVELFKALAAMNDGNDREQWFVCTESYKESESISWEVGDFDFYYLDEDYTGKKWRKATSNEIVEHFKNRKK